MMKFKHNYFQHHDQSLRKGKCSDYMLAYFQASLVWHDEHHHFQLYDLSMRNERFLDETLAKLQAGEEEQDGHDILQPINQCLRKGPIVKAVAFHDILG